jgi:hypothetical protein
MTTEELLEECKRPVLSNWTWRELAAAVLDLAKSAEAAEARLDEARDVCAEVFDLRARLAEVERERDAIKLSNISNVTMRDKAWADAKALRGALADARAALDRDRTGLAAALNQIQAEVNGRAWMRAQGDGSEGGSWGSYPYPEHTIPTLRREISWAFDAMSKIATRALSESGRLADAAVREARAALAGERKP